VHYTTPHYIRQLWLLVEATTATTPKNTTPTPTTFRSISSATPASQHLTSPIGSYLWNFRHRLVP
jgi:hypothetical protein